jgi:hypothetical protein
MFGAIRDVEKGYYIADVYSGLPGNMTKEYLEFFKAAPSMLTLIKATEHRDEVHQPFKTLKWLYHYSNAKDEWTGEYERRCKQREILREFAKMTLNDEE